MLICLSFPMCDCAYALLYICVWLANGFIPCCRCLQVRRYWVIWQGDRPRTLVHQVVGLGLLCFPSCVRVIFCTSYVRMPFYILGYVVFFFFGSYSLYCFMYLFYICQCHVVRSSELVVRLGSGSIVRSQPNVTSRVPRIRGVTMVKFQNPICLTQRLSL